MNSTTASAAFDSRRFREVLGQYPTGVCVVTAVGAGGNAAGMAVGSFTSVSLDPPLVAFLPDKGSTSWPKIRDARAFCVNVLGAGQESVCRRFASKAEDRFKDLAWQPARSGAPKIDGAVAWIDCDLETVHEAGDHYIVIGRVLDLDVGDPSLPLLFFRGGYGRFSPRSFAVADPDVLEQLRLVDKAREAMEGVAADLDVECTAAVVAGDEIVVVARAGSTGRRDPVVTRVGWRLPFRPPIGTTFVAWGGPSALDAWLGRLGRTVTGAEHDLCREMVRRVRARGFSVGVGHDVHAQLWESADRHATAAPSRDEEDVHRVMNELFAGYEQTELVPGQSHEVRNMSVPVFGPNGEAVIRFTIYGFPHTCTCAEVDVYVARLLDAARSATAALGGREPDVVDAPATDLGDRRGS